MVLDSGRVDTGHCFTPQIKRIRAAISDSASLQILRPQLAQGWHSQLSTGRPTGRLLAPAAETCCSDVTAESDPKRNSAMRSWRSSVTFISGLAHWRHGVPPRMAFSSPALAIKAIGLVQFDREHGADEGVFAVISQAKRAAKSKFNTIFKLGLEIEAQIVGGLAAVEG